MSAKIKPMAEDDPRHGTVAGYLAHRRRGGKTTCEPCLAANRERTRENLAAKAAAEPRTASLPDVSDEVKEVATRVIIARFPEPSDAEEMLEAFGLR